VSDTSVNATRPLRDLQLAPNSNDAVGLRTMSAEPFGSAVGWWYGSPTPKKSMLGVMPIQYEPAASSIFSPLSVTDTRAGPWSATLRMTAVPALGSSLLVRELSKMFNTPVYSPGDQSPLSRL
jgi:hypothetical protein